VSLEENARIMAKLFEKIWKEKKLPTEWLRENICKLPKKGVISDCNNWRGVTILNVAVKIFTRCIFERIQEPVEKILWQNQAGFRKGRGCMDMIFILRKLIVESLEFQQALFVNFIDFKRVFDSVFREALWKVLHKFPEKIVRMIKALYEGFECAVIHEGNLSAYFKLETAVKQGCLMLGLLFLIVIDWLMKRVTENGSLGVRWIGEEELEDLDYADDLGLVWENFEDTQVKMDRLAEKMMVMGLKVSAKKTEILRINAQDDKSYP
jgi:hypothetical protein